MEAREPVKHHHYLASGLSWYVSTIVAALIAALIIANDGGAHRSGYEVAIEIGVAVMVILVLISPGVAWLILRRMKDPAAGMTAGAMIMLGPVLLISGPFVLVTPIASRYVAIMRWDSGGY